MAAQVRAPLGEDEPGRVGPPKSGDEHRRVLAAVGVHRGRLGGVEQASLEVQPPDRARALR